MSVTAETENALRDAAALFVEQADILARGGSLYDGGHIFPVLHALEALSPGSDILRRYRREAGEELAKHVFESETGRAVIRIAAETSRWQGSRAEFTEALGLDPDPDIFDNTSWLSETLGWVGVLVHSADGQISLQKMVQFGYEVPARLRTVDTRAEASDEPRAPKALLSGHWRGLGLDPERCAYCLRAPFEEIEHFVPKKRGGTDAIDNLFPSCVKCNRGPKRGKWTRDPWEWLEAEHPARLGFFRSLFE